MTHELNLCLLGGGLFIGLLFGVIAQRSRFCVLAAVSNWVLMRDWRQAHGYLAAVAVAIVGTAVLEWSGLVAVATTSFRGARINWVGNLAGGVLFGFGTVLAGGCAGRLLVRGAEGSGGAWVAMLAAGASAALVAYGAIEPLRTWLVDATAITPGLDDTSIATLIGLPSTWTVALIVGACVLVIFVTARRGTSGSLLLAGALVGGAVVAGWWISGWLANDEFETTAHPVSLAFVGPLAQTTQLAATGELRGSQFHLALLVGVLAGAALSALTRRQFRWIRPRGAELGRAIVGGSMLGSGAVFAGGCNIGQGLSGMSTLSISALLAIVGIMAGMRLGLSWLMRAESASPASRGRIAAAWSSLRRLVTREPSDTMADIARRCCQ